MKLTFPEFDEREIEKLRECLDSGWVTQGPMTQKFETLFAERHQAHYALATTSCTAALHLATSALELGPGDEVIIPAFTWVTSAHSAEYVGAKAVFADVEPHTFNLDPVKLEAALTPRTRAVVVVHLFGLAAKMDEILAITKPRGIKIIEDAACAVGTTYAGKPIGAIGDIGCFSFHPRKVITTGEGGMVTTNDARIAEIVKSVRNHGSTGHPDFAAGRARPYTMGNFDRLGYNLRLSDIQAAVGVAQLAKLDRLVEERQALGRSYAEILGDIDDIALPWRDERCGHTYQSFVIRVLDGGRERRNRIMDHFESCGIQTRPGTHAAHRLGYYANKYKLRPEEFPVAVASEETSITLPLFPRMTLEDQERVARTLREGLAIR